ncbi:MAG: tRNA dihydrouridine(20/20a) synthase DusA [Bradymonadia bacterium]
MKPASPTEVPVISIAPMMDRTDRHYRLFMRQLSRRTLLYTEMITAPAILNGDRDYLLGFHPQEHPISLQVGGDDPQALTECARIAEDRGYDEINLNVGCPSSRVQSGSFGVVLMKRPERVAACVEAMQKVCSIPVTVKHRIGVDELDGYDDMLRFVDIVADSGCTRFTVHARKAWLQGLSPKENRNIPPLRHPEVHRLKAERPHLWIETNGGIKSLDEVQHHLEHVDAAMLGRAAYDDPYLFAEVDQRLFGETTPVPSRHEAAMAMTEWVEHWVSQGGRSHHATRHMLHLFNGQPGARRWRRHLTEAARDPKSGPEVITEALEMVPR